MKAGDYLNYTVKQLAPSEHSVWDQFVKDSPQGTIFHTSYWLNAFGGETRIYGCYKGDALFAGLPIAYSSRLGMKHGKHPLLTPYLGVIFRENKNTKYVSKISAGKKMSRVIAEKLKRDFDILQFNFVPLYVDLQPFIWEGFSSSIRYTFILSLDDLKQVWRNMDDARRNDIRRAEKDGIRVDDNAEFRELFSLVKKTFDRQKMQPRFQTAAFQYNRILESRRQCRSFLARDSKGVPIAGVYIVWDWNKAYYLLGGYDSKHKHHGASALAMWTAIKFTREELGLRTFDFEGSMIPQIERFFRKFGGRLTPYYSVSWSKPSVKFMFDARRLIGKSLRKIGLR